MLWLGLTLLLAVLNSVKFLYSKKLALNFSAYLLAFFTSLVAILLLVPLVVYLGMPVIGDGFWLALLMAGTINVITAVLIFKALKITDVSLIVPLLSLSPLLLLVTSPFLVNEFPSSMGLVGVLIILAGTYVLNFKDKVSFKPFTSLIHNKGQRYILIAVALWAISSNYYKIGMQQSSPIFFIFMINLFIAVALLPVIINNNYFSTIKANIKSLSILGVIYTVSSVLQWVAVSMALIVYVLSIKNIGTIFTIIGSHYIFKEKSTVQRIVASVIIVLGAVVIAQGNRIKNQIQQYLVISLDTSCSSQPF